MASLPGTGHRADLPSSATDRVSFRPATPADAEATGAYRCLPEVYEWLPLAPDSPEAWAELMAEPARLARTLVVEHEGAVVGDLYLHVHDAWAQREVAEGGSGVQAEVGWAIHPAYGGRGLATEAVTELVRVCFTERGVRRVTATCFADNAPSWRLMERLGMRRETHARAESLHRTRGWLDSVGYALLAEEWRQRARPAAAVG